MLKFPKQEAEISALAKRLWRGLFDHTALYPTPPVGSHKGSKTQRRNGTTDFLLRTENRKLRTNLLPQRKMSTEIFATNGHELTRIILLPKGSAEYGDGGFVKINN